MRETISRGTCRGCAANRDGRCQFTGLPVKDRDTCRAPRPPAKRSRKKPPAISERVVVAATDVADLREARLRLGLTSKELAGKIGISASFLRDLETGLRPGSIRTFVKWLLVLEQEGERCRDL